MQTRTFSRGFQFLEGPRWHDGRLWASDQHGHTVYSFDAEGVATVEASLDDLPSGLGFLPDGALLISSMRDRRLLRRESDGTLVVHADLSRLGAGWVNDMVVDGRGRAYVGFTFGRLYERAAERDLLVLVEPDGSHRVVSDDVAIPNGAAITPDGSALVLSESGRARVSRFTLTSDGSLTDRTTMAEFGQDNPDGLCLDAEGAAWIAYPRAKRFRRVSGSGELLAEIEVPGKAVACVLGGDDRRTLFHLVDEGPGEAFQRLKEAADGSADSELSDSRSRIDAVTVDVPGAGTP